jgi:hypothetical protein
VGGSAHLPARPDWLVGRSDVGCSDGTVQTGRPVDVLDVSGLGWSGPGWLVARRVPGRVLGDRLR